jgi:hypothetical protein
MARWTPSTIGSGKVNIGYVPEQQSIEMSNEAWIEY